MVRPVRSLASNLTNTHTRTPTPTGSTNGKIEHDEDDVLKERLHESRRKYFDLRVAHDALLRKLRKYQSGSGSNMSLIGGGKTTTLDVHNNARRRLLSSKRRAKSGIM